MSLEAVYHDIREVAPQEYYVRPGHVTSYHTPHSRNLHPDPLVAQRLRFAPDAVDWAETSDAHLAVIDKASPHVITEAMIAVFGLRNNMLSFTDLSAETGRRVLEWMHSYVSYASDPEVTKTTGTTHSFVRIGINVDHETSDRGSVQGVRFLHPHCMTLPYLPKHQARSRPIDFSRPNTELASLIDPLAKIGPLVLRDHFRAGSFSKEVYETFVEPDKDEAGLMPLSFNLRFRNAWDGLLDDATIQAMANIEQVMQIIHARIRRSFTLWDGTKTVAWQRHQLRDPAQTHEYLESLPAISYEAKFSLWLLASGLKNIDSETMQELAASRQAGAVSRAEHILTYPGLAYGLNFYSPGTVTDIQAQSMSRIPTYMSIQPLLRRASGVAGVNIDAQGKLFKVDRHNTVIRLDEQQEDLRRAYHQGYATRLKP